jgi:transcriptional regulator with XRE-family HTH domain
MKSDVAEILQSELSRRCRANPRYSLRAFARTLGVSPANLSLVLNRKREASKRTIQRMLERLELEPFEREIVSGRPLPMNFAENIQLKTLEQVSTWLGYAILSLVKTKNFVANERAIASRLGVTAHEVRNALSALRNAGLLKGWTRANGGLRIANPVSTAITRSFHRELIEKALQSMEADQPSERDISSITFAMSSERFEEACNEIRRFRLRMAGIFEKSGESTDVYNLTMQLVPVTRGKK